MSKSKLSVVKDVNFGVYVWVTDDNKVVQDEDRNYMCISAKRGDQIAINAITAAAQYYGVPNGRPYFVEGSTKITEEQYEEQLGRMLNGEVPNPDDPGHLKDILRNGQ